MLAYFARRIFQALLILLGISFVTFALLFLLPADPVRQIAGRAATAETVANIRHQLGLDQPFAMQYLPLPDAAGAWRPWPVLYPEDRGLGADRRPAAGDAAC